MTNKNDEQVFASLTFGSPEVRERAVRMVMDHEGEYASRWATVASISAKIGCSAHTLLDWVKKAEVEQRAQTWLDLGYGRQVEGPRTRGP